MPNLLDMLIENSLSKNVIILFHSIKKSADNFQETFEMCLHILTTKLGTLVELTITKHTYILVMVLVSNHIVLFHVSSV